MERWNMELNKPMPILGRVRKVGRTKLSDSLSQIEEAKKQVGMK